MPLSDLQVGWVKDLPVCFPTRPCADYPPIEADIINLTSTLTPASAALGIGGFVLLGVAIVLVAFGLWPQPERPRPGPWVVAVGAIATLLGMFVAGVAGVRSSAISEIYGLEGSGGPAFYGSWWLVRLAGEAMTAAGVLALIATATVAVLRLRVAVAGE